MPYRKPTGDISVWVVQHKGPDGDINASLGIAEHLTTKPKLVFTEDIEAAGGVAAYVEQLRAKTPPEVMPDVIVTTRATDFTIDTILALKKLSGNRTYLVSFRDRNPSLPRREFDLSVMPEHEARATGGNVFICDGIPHRVTPALLKQGKESWRDEFSGYKDQTKIAVMVGGDSVVIPSEQGGGPLTVEEATKLGQQLHDVAKMHNACLLITNSHRTPLACWRALCDQLTDIPVYTHDYQLDAAKGNPYFGLLALADVLVPTADSMSMCAECCSTGKPVFIAGREFGNVRSDHRRFSESLIVHGHARPLERHCEEWTLRPVKMNTAGAIAHEITRRLQKRKQAIAI